MAGGRTPPSSSWMACVRPVSSAIRGSSDSCGGAAPSSHLRSVVFRTPRCSAAALTLRLLRARASRTAAAHRGQPPACPSAGSAFTASLTSRSDHHGPDHHGTAHHRIAENWHRIAARPAPDLKQQVTLQHTSAFGTVNYSASKSGRNDNSYGFCIKRRGRDRIPFTGKGIRIMIALIYGFVLVASSFTLGLFGFFVGRCARKMPIVDDKLPWAIHRSQPSPLSRNGGRSDRSGRRPRPRSRR